MLVQFTSESGTVHVEPIECLTRDENQCQVNEHYVPPHEYERVFSILRAMGELWPPMHIDEADIGNEESNRNRVGDELDTPGVSR